MGRVYLIEMNDELQILVSNIELATDQLSNRLPESVMYYDRLKLIKSSLDKPGRLVEIYNGHAVPEGDTPYIWNQEVLISGKVEFYQTLFTDLRELLEENDGEFVIGVVQ